MGILSLAKTFIKIFNNPAIDAMSLDIDAMSMDVYAMDSVEGEIPQVYIQNSIGQ